MNTLPWSDCKRLNVDELKQIMPLMVTADGVPLFLADNPDQVIGMSDLHPRVRNMLRGIEGKARVGQPGITRVVLDEFRNNLTKQET